MINWFPGHMNKTLKQMQSDSKLCDCFLYVLDARCPDSCINPEFLRIVKGKPIIYILNKADLIEKSDLDKLKLNFTTEDSACISLNSIVSGTSKIIVSTIKSIFKNRLDANKAQGVNFVLRAMVIGVPNSGKSTIVNNLCNKGRAVTGNKAGVTKNKQWVKIDNLIDVMDTPGVLLPSFDDEEKAYNLAFVGSVKDDVINIVDVATKLISKLKNTSVLASKYGVIYDNNMTDIDILSLIAKKRGCIIKGGEIDFERVAKLLLTDFRSGKLGKICLE